MSEYQPVPVNVAKQIAESFQKSQVVILSYDQEHNLTHTTTYGVAAFDKEQAAAIGELVTKAIGCDMSKRVNYEDFHNDYDPALLREATEIFRTIRSRQGVTAVQLQQIERWLKAAGLGLREG